MRDSTKGALLLASLLLGVVVSGLIAHRHARQRKAAEARALLLEGRADALLEREAAAKAATAEADRKAEGWRQEVAHLRAALAVRPLPSAPQPVPADASASLVVRGIQDLGLHPEPLAGPLALGLTLPDGRTVLQWGREAQRIPAYVARLGVLEDLARAQEGATSALLQRADSADDALAAADARAAAQAQRAEALQEAMRLQPGDRPWSAGLLVGIDAFGARRTGAYASRAWGPVQVQVVVLGNVAAIGGGIRF